jgi:hypothetical protein
VCFLFLFQSWALQAQQAQEPTNKAQGATPQTSKSTEAKKTASHSKSAPVDDFDGGTASFELFYWYNPTHPHMRTGVGATAGTNPSTLDYPGKSQPSPGIVVNLPGGKYNTVHISYFQTTSHQAGSTPTQALNFFGTDYAAGYAIDSGYSIKNVQFSWDYMTWPFPIEGSTFRLKTLWQVQVTSIHTLIDGPFEVDTSGNSSPVASEKTNWFAYPSFGLAVEKIFSKNLRWEARGSGFGLPHRASIGDVESTINYRHKSFELVIGAREFYFKTNPGKTEYVRASLPGAFVGLRWYYPK